MQVQLFQGSGQVGFGHVIESSHGLGRGLAFGKCFQDARG